MLRQIFTTDSTTIQTAIQAYQRGAGPKTVARLVPGGEVVEIINARGRGAELRVQTTDQQWHKPFICYKETPE